uniref:Uncharacterized protein n=1 Tax=Anguilla anguilla TaxID=7936 RepID=A0A0E9PSK8_ANGAN
MYYSQRFITSYNSKCLRLKAGTLLRKKPGN